jgi:hypothetical protein
MVLLLERQQRCQEVRGTAVYQLFLCNTSTMLRTIATWHAGEMPSRSYCSAGGPTHTGGEAVGRSAAVHTFSTPGTMHGLLMLRGGSRHARSADAAATNRSGDQAAASACGSDGTTDASRAVACCRKYCLQSTAGLMQHAA